MPVIIASLRSAINNIGLAAIFPDSDFEFGRDVGDSRADAYKEANQGSPCLIQRSGADEYKVYRSLIFCQFFPISNKKIYS